MDEEILEEQMIEGNLFFKREDYENALKCYERVAELNPDIAVVWYLKGVCLYRLGRNEEALSCFDKTITLSPDEVLPYEAKGVCLYTLMRFDEAVPCFLSALQKSPKDVETLFFIATSYIFLNKNEKADEYVEKALFIDPLKTVDLFQTLFQSVVARHPQVSAEEKIRIQEMFNEIISALKKSKKIGY